MPPFFSGLFLDFFSVHTYATLYERRTVYICNGISSFRHAEVTVYSFLAYRMVQDFLTGLTIFRGKHLQRSKITRHSGCAFTAYRLAL